MADTPEARELGKHVVSPVASTAEVEQVAAGATQLPPQRIEGVPESGDGRLALTDIRKRKVEVPALAPIKSLKVSTGSTAHQVVEAQAAVQRGGASARADPKELVAQGEVTEVATERAGEETLAPCEAEARESDGAEVPLVAEATEGETEAPGTSEAKATEARALRTVEAEVAGTGAPETTEAGVVGIGALETIEDRVAGTEAPETAEAGVAGAGVSAAKPAAQEVEAEAGQALIPPPVQGPPLL
ncbi:uncharacterized protein [Miscanthus floridulus]|uniref:uncharacterized protein n=1 Tax=Miscanthus floridulus TaxID=154761 RepID=UPI00345A6F6E